MTLNIANKHFSFRALVLILAVRQVVDPNPFPAGLHSASIVVTTPSREVKFTAPTRERHDMWFNVSLFTISPICF